jgi:hypothetical protein
VSTIVLYKLNNVIDRDRYNMRQEMFMTSSISPFVMPGRIVDVQRASKVLPEPGGPCMRRLQPQFHCRLLAVSAGCDSRPVCRTRLGHVWHYAAVSLGVAVEVHHKLAYGCLGQRLARRAKLAVLADVGGAHL